MKILKVFFFLATAFFTINTTLAADITFYKETFTLGNTTIPYRKANIQGSEGKASLVIYLHGGSSKGNDNETQLNEPAVQSICSWLSRNNQKTIMIVPQCPKDKSWLGTMLPVLKGLLQTFIDRGVADERRVYILGGSMGGTGTWNMLASYPDFFAAAMPVAGNPSGLNAEKVKETPIYTVMGTADVIMKIDNVESFLSEMDLYGAEYQFDIEEGWTHENVCKQSYTDERLQWVFSHTKSLTDNIHITEADAGSEIVSVRWFTLNGQALANKPQLKGTYLKLLHLKNGRTLTEKVVFS